MSSLPERTDDLLPWDRMPDEPAKAYQAFIVYRDLGYGGSVAKAGRVLGKATRTLEDMSRRWHWVARRDAYMAEWERRQREAREDELLAATRREAAIGSQLTAIAAARIFGREAGVREDGSIIEEIPAIDPAALDPIDAAVLGEKGIRMRRLAHGQPTDILKGMHAITAADLKRAVEGVYEILIGHVDEDRRPRAASEVQAFIETGRLPWAGE